MTAILAPRPTGLQLARRSWRYALGAFAALAPLVIITLLLGAGLSVAQAAVHTSMLAPKLESMSLVKVAIYLGANIAAIILESAIAAPLAVAVHRFILLGEPSWGPSMPARKFFFWSAGLRLVFFAATAIALVAAAVSFVQGLLTLLVRIGFAIAIVNLAMLFPAVAVGVPAQSLEARIDASAKDMDGHFWLFVWAMAITLLPVFAVSMPPLVLLARRITAATPAAGNVLDRTHIVMGIVGGVTSVVELVLAVAVASCFYAWVRYRDQVQSAQTATSTVT